MSTDNLHMIREQSPDQPGKSFSLRTLVLCAVVSVGMTLLLAGTFYWLFFSGSRISTDDAYVETDLAPVNSRIMGYVREVLVAENQHVERDQVLAVLDDSDVKIELAYKEAKYKKAAADIARARKLIRSQAISPADLETAEANLTANKADLEGTLLKRTFTKVRSLVTGVVGKRNVQPGQFVQPGQGLFVVIPDGNLWVKANYKETQLQKVRPGMDVLISVDAYPGTTWFGKVESIYPSSGALLSLLPPENATGNFTKIVQRIPVKISITSNAEKGLRPGMSVISTIVVK